MLDQLFGNNTRPNKFTIGMGKLIRSAREETGLSQRDLAEKIYRRQAALSDMENGKMEPDASTLLLLGYHLDKPISFFYPEPYKPNQKLDALNEIETELLLYVRKLEKVDVTKLTAQVRALAEYSTHLDKR